ncbi:uncharacterized protein LOC111702261 [Eurytemora carolleeae]|uniref:uncharacterized protein LOC111702261 n=1 Tax=Eurytemora carolleeae TaxID=1294199 RepID=UPI000C77A391|nr:uncharacterized protein LOC111702261 [Eurytemora carolleeae]|eukprot:XP_023329665.1 uncharacterized protein LOC111702261 [Eurytemora affinis]
MADEKKDGAKNPSYCYSTAVSDAVLAATCVYGLGSMAHAHWLNFRKFFLFGYIWFGFCLFASCLGVLRFGQKNLSVSVKNAHVLISWVAGAVGLPNLLAQFYTYTFNKPEIGNLHLMTCGIPILAYFSRRSWIQELAGKAVAVVSVISLGLGGYYNRNIYAVAAALCLIISSPLDRSDNFCLTKFLFRPTFKDG